MLIESTQDLYLIRQFYRTKTIVLCHGCFDIFHYGHLTYLKESRQLGDILVVSVTNDEFIKKGPERPVFDVVQRLEILDALKCVDYCCVSDDYTAVDIIRRLRPNIYSKATDVQGKELDPKENLFMEFKALQEVGGKLIFIEKVPSLSSSLIISRLK